MALIYKVIFFILALIGYVLQNYLARLVVWKLATAYGLGTRPWFPWFVKFFMVVCIFCYFYVVGLIWSGFIR